MVSLSINTYGHLNIYQIILQLKHLKLTLYTILRNSLVTELWKLQESNDQSLALCQQLAWLFKEEIALNVLETVLYFRKFDDPRVLISIGTI